MEKFNMDMDWKFHKGDILNPEVNTHTECYMAAKAGGAIGAASPDYDISSWENVNLPHDWAVYNKFEEKWGPANGYKARGKAWYTKRFRLDEEDRDKQIYIEFQGISSHSVVYLNGSVVGRNFCGYNSFILDITDMALYGEQVNSLVVFADATPIEGWWYEGAGIYRHVNLYKCEKLHIKQWDIFVHPEKKSADVWDAITDTTVTNNNSFDVSFKLKSYILDNNDNVVGKDEITDIIRAGKEKTVNQSILTYSPYLWDIDSPNLYRMVSELYIDEKLIDKHINKFGFRTISVDCNDGFFLNGRRVQLYGTCNHQDHAGVGVAVPDEINEYRIKLLKEMGSNAYRCAHGNPSPEILDYCDKYGILVMNENRNFNSSPDGLKQACDMVKRDRNHPSVIMYSIFNEEPLQGTPTGRKLAASIRREIEKYDKTRFFTGAMNGGVLSENGAVNEVDITGFNYITGQYDSFREKFPNMPMLGSENDSAFQTRGIYKTDHSKNIIDCYDSEAASWGNTYRDGFKQVDTRKHIMGLFIWTGFDYRGEPTPFEWPSISTQFGIMDTCGFKKDAFYLNKSFFTDEPIIHLLPHWNMNDGENVRVMIYTNCTEAELFLNGVSLGKKDVDKYDMTDWNVEFEKGTLSVNGFINGKLVCSDSVTTAGKPSKIVLESSSDTVNKNGAVAINVHTVDENDLTVPTASDLIEFRIDGGEILGVGNGDPNSHEADKASSRHLFNGYCQVIVSPKEEIMKITACAKGLKEAEIIFNVLENETVYIPSVNEQYISKWRKASSLSEKYPNPTEKIEDHDMNTWETVTVGSGYDEIFENTTGFEIYRTSIEVSDESQMISFKEVTGENVSIYINGEKCFDKDCRWGAPAQLKVKSKGMVEIAVIIKAANKGGINKPVILLD